MELKTKKGESFFIDDEDYDLIKDMYSYKSSQGYIHSYCNSDKKFYRLHRVLMGVSNSSKPMIDHINMDKLDNRKSNLRFCTPSENQKNRKGRGKSKYLGVSVHVTKITKQLKSGEFKDYISSPKFRATIVIDGKQKHLGSFINEIDVAKCYNEYAKKHHGEFARLNTL